MPRTAPKPVTDLQELVAKAQRAVKAGEKALASERELRRRRVVEAVDAGYPYREIARWLGGGTGMVSKIVSTPEPEEEA